MSGNMESNIWTIKVVLDQLKKDEPSPELQARIIAGILAASLNDETINKLIKCMGPIVGNE